MWVGLQTMGFICPNTSNQGNWDPGTATVFEPSCWREPPCTYVYRYIYTLTSRPSCSSKEGSRMRLLVVSVFVWVLNVSVLICAVNHIYMYVCGERGCSIWMCLLGIHAQPHNNLHLGVWSCSSLTSVRSLDLAQYFFPYNAHLSRYVALKSSSAPYLTA